MTVGILADSHDNLPALKYFVEYYRNYEVDWVIHAGDLISPFTVPVLASLEIPVEVVLGNNDGDHATLREKAQDSLVSIHQAPLTLERNDHNFLISHRPEDLPDSIPDEINYVIHGHTHEPKFKRKSDYILINPGEAGGWLSGVSRAVCLEPESGTLESEIIPRP